MTEKPGKDWYPYDDGVTIGELGSEQGEILYDEEHGYGARITIERSTHPPFSITCGIYGWTFVTSYFATLEEAQAQYDQMKTELQELLPLLAEPRDGDEEDILNELSELVGQFAAKY